MNDRYNESRIATKSAAGLQEKIASTNGHNAKEQCQSAIAGGHEPVSRRQSKEAPDPYRLLVDHTRDILLLIARDDGRILEANTAALEASGYNRQELLGRTIHDLRTTETQDQIANQMTQAGTGGILFETRHRRKDGSTFPVEVSSRGTTFRGRHVLVSVVRDITDRQRAQEVLRESEENYRLIFEHSLDGILLTTPQGTIMEANPAACAMLGRTQEEIRRIGRAGIVEPGPALNRVLAERARTGKSRGELIYIRKDGTRFPVDRSSAILGDKAGASRAFVIFRDITERKRAEEAIKQSEERFRHLVETTSDWVWGVDENSVYTYVSPKVRDILGYEPHEVLGKLPFDFMPPEEARRVRAAYESVCREQKPFNALENINQHKDGHLVILETSGVPLFDSAGQFRGYRGIDRDITKRKEAEAMLRKRVEEVERLLEVVPAAVWVAQDPQCRTITGNRRANEFYEASSGENVSATTRPEMRRFFSPDGRELTAEELPMQRAVATNRDVLDVELHVQTPSGRWMAMLGSAVPLRDEAGEARGCIGAFLDISERKRAEEAIRHSEWRLNRSQEMAHVGSWELEVPSLRLAWSDEVYRIFGVKPQEFGATHGAFMASVHPDDRAALEDAYFGSLKEGRDSYELEHRVIRKSDGAIRIVHEKCNHLRDETGRIIRSVGMVQDITERRQMEEALRESEERLRLALQGAQTGIWEWQISSGSIHWSDQVPEVAGVPAECFASHTIKNFDDLLHPEDRPRVRRAIQQAIDSRSHFTCEFRIVAPGGQVQWLANSGRACYGTDGKPLKMTGTVTNITERKRIEEKLQQWNESLEKEVCQRTAQLRALTRELARAEREERRRLAGLLHDHLQQSVTVALWKIMEAQEAATEPAQRQMLIEARDRIKEAITITRSLTVELYPPVLRDKHFSATLDWLAQSMQDKCGLAVALECDGDADVTDGEWRFMVFQAVRELLWNVAKHAGVSRARVRLAAGRDGRTEVTVADDGIGVDLSRVKAKVRSGKHFGLFSLQERIEHLGGQLQIDSAPGRGMTVTLAVPGQCQGPGSPVLSSG